jgi:inorganic pyrophosphatase
VTVRAVVEVPRGSFVKRELHDGQRLDFISPLPSPFNYGYLPEVEGQDGDPMDAVILGPRLALGAEARLPVVARVRFVDDGQVDTKLVLSSAPLTRRQRLMLVGFFRFYARAKRILGLLRGATGPTRFEGLDEGGD